MSDSSKPKILVGAALLLVTTAIILYVSSAGEAILPGLIGSAAALAMAAGALLLGTSEGGRAV
jgi:hypothetical protein